MQKKIKIKNYFWDSCIFIAFLNNDTHAYDIDALKSILDDASNGLCKIYTSIIAYAEVSPNRMLGSEYNDFSDFLNAFGVGINIVHLSPQICQTAASLKDVNYKKGTSSKRVLTTGDAIMLASALDLEDSFNVLIDEFNTYDNGGGKAGAEGKGVPLINYQEWLDDVSLSSTVQRVVDLKRCKPEVIQSSMSLSV